MRRSAAWDDEAIGDRWLGTVGESVTSSFGGNDVDDSQASGGKQSELERPELRE